MNKHIRKPRCEDMYKAYIENQDKTIYVFIDSPQIQRAIKQYKNS